MGDEATRPARLEQVSIALPQPARIEGTINRAKFPDAGSVSAQLLGQAWSTWEKHWPMARRNWIFRELPPGDYHVYIQSKPERKPQHRGHVAPGAASPTSACSSARETKAVAF